MKKMMRNTFHRKDSIHLLLSESLPQRKQVDSNLTSQRSNFPSIHSRSNNLENHTRKSSINLLKYRFSPSSFQQSTLHNNQTLYSLEIWSPRNKLSQDKAVRVLRVEFNLMKSHLRNENLQFKNHLQLNQCSKSYSCWLLLNQSKLIMNWVLFMNEKSNRSFQVLLKKFCRCKDTDLRILSLFENLILRMNSILQQRQRIWSWFHQELRKPWLSDKRKVCILWKLF